MTEETMSRVVGLFDDDLFIQMLETLPISHSFVFMDIRSWKKEDYDRIINDMKTAGYKVYEDDSLKFDENDIDIRCMKIFKEYHDNIKSNDIFRVGLFASMASVGLNLTDYLATRITFKRNG